MEHGNVIPGYGGDSFENYWFLLYSSNPTRETVKVFIDGDEHVTVMKWDRFVSMVETTVGYQISYAVRETLRTYGTFWVLDRENSRVMKTSVANDEDLVNLRDKMNREHDHDTPDNVRRRTQESINPAEDLAYAQTIMPALDAPEEEDSSRTKRRGISLLFPRRK